MEERRLKSILAHLSACTSCQMGKSSVLNATSKVEKHTVFLPGNTHLQHKEHMVHTSLSRSRSSSDVLESRLVGFAEESSASKNAWYAVPREMFLSHGHSSGSPSKHERGGWLLSKSHTSEESDDSLYLCSQDVTKTHTPGYSLETTEFGGKQIDSRCSIPLDQRVSKHQSQAFNTSPLSSKGDHHQEVAHEPQISSRSFDISENTEGSNIQSFKNLHTFDSQSAEVGNDAVGSISRNNVMTGQRRRIVEDCTFCLIIQGLSPAFKLYEDDVCVCILDVQPLSHGHSLLIPKTHFPSLELTPPEIAAAMCATVPLISMAVMQATNCDSFNLLVNSGKAAGQVVFHTHFHIIPRRTGDNLWRSEDGNRRALPVGHETALLVQQIRHNLSNNRL